jgi:hypothetical protein
MEFSRLVSSEDVIGLNGQNCQDIRHNSNRQMDGMGWTIYDPHIPCNLAMSHMIHQTPKQSVDDENESNDALH